MTTYLAKTGSMWHFGCRRQWHWDRRIGRRGVFEADLPPSDALNSIGTLREWNIVHGSGTAAPTALGELEQKIVCDDEVRE